MYVFEMFEDGGKPIIFPVVPEGYTVSSENKNEPVTLVDYGEVNILRTPGLKTFEFDLFFPAMPTVTAHYPEGFKRPEYFLDTLYKWREERKPVNFFIMRNTPDMSEAWKTTSMKVSVENCDIEENWRMYGIGVLAHIILKKWASYEVKLFEKGSDGTYTEKKKPIEQPDSVVRLEKAKENTTAANVAKAAFNDFDKYGWVKPTDDDPLKEFDPVYGIIKDTPYEVGNAKQR